MFIAHLFTITLGAACIPLEHSSWTKEELRRSLLNGWHRREQTQEGERCGLKRSESCSGICFSPQRTDSHICVYLFKSPSVSLAHCKPWLPWQDTGSPLWSASAVSCLLSWHSVYLVPQVLRYCHVCSFQNVLPVCKQNFSFLVFTHHVLPASEAALTCAYPGKPHLLILTLWAFLAYQEEMTTSMVSLFTLPAHCIV